MVLVIKPLGVLRLSMWAAAGIAAPAAQATVYRWTGSGTVTSISAISDGVAAPVPAGTIHVGDALSFSLSFSTEMAFLSSTFDADPTINLYNLADLKLMGWIGGFSFSRQPSAIGDNLQLWNGNIGSDAQIISSYYPAISYLPFEIGPASSLQNVGIFAVDYSASARGNDLILDMKPLDYFNSKFVHLNFYNPETKFIVQIFGSYTGTLSAVPEAATWTLMVLGFAAVGTTMRWRTKEPVIFN